MDNLQSTHKEIDDEDDSLGQTPNPSSSSPSPIPIPDEEIEIEIEAVKSNGIHASIDDIDEEEEEEEDDDDDNANGSAKKRKALSSLTETTPPNPTKKPKKKTNNSVWSHKSTSRKGKKKSKPSSAAVPEDKVLITPIPKFPDRSDDSPAAPVALSKVHKAERVELSEDRLAAASTKGYRMVRATRGVEEGHWYFEIKILKLGPTGHARLGWSTDKGDLQAPVGYDASSYGYRDVDGSKVHKAARQAYGTEGYGEGDVIGFYIGLPEGGKYAPKPPHFVWYKGQKYMYSGDGKDEPPKVVPGSDISFFKNGVCQGTAFKDVLGGRYYPAASMYTMPNESNCEVRFNFGPHFDFFPQEFGGRQTPRPVIEVPYIGYDLKVGDHIENGVAEKTN